MRPRAVHLLACVVLAVGGCVLVPVTQHRYDPGCRNMVRQMTLQPVQIASIGSCSNEGCVAAVALAGVTAAASAIVSGSVVVAGNVVYWMERVGRCDGSSGPVPPPLLPLPTPTPAQPVHAPLEAP